MLGRSGTRRGCDASAAGATRRCAHQRNRTCAFCTTRASIGRHQARVQAAEAAKQVEQEAKATQTAKTAAAAANHETATSKPKPKPVHEWTVDNVCAFFTAQKLGEYNAAVAENEIDGNMLQQLAAQKGLDELGIKSKLHVIKVEAALAKAAEDTALGVAQVEVRIRTCHICTGTWLRVASHSFSICTQTRLSPALPLWAETRLPRATAATHPCHIYAMGPISSLSASALGRGLSLTLLRPMGRSWLPAASSTQATCSVPYPA